MRKRLDVLREKSKDHLVSSEKGKDDLIHIKILSEDIKEDPRLKDLEDFVQEHESEIIEAYSFKNKR